MTLTAGLGYALSPDWVAYFNTFNLLASTSWSEFDRFAEMASMEKGYLGLNKILVDYGFDFLFHVPHCQPTLRQLVWSHRGMDFKSLRLSDAIF